MAEKSRRWSPYNYVEDDPIRLTDPDGMQVDGGGAFGDFFQGNAAIDIFKQLQSQPPKKKKKAPEPAQQTGLARLARYGGIGGIDPTKAVTNIVNAAAKALATETSIMGHSQNETPGGVVATMKDSRGSPGGHAKNLSNSDHIDLTNVFDPLGVITPNDGAATLMTSFATDVVTTTTSTVKETIENTYKAAPSKKTVATGFVILPNSNDTVKETGSRSQNGATMLFITPNFDLTTHPDE